MANYKLGRARIFDLSLRRSFIIGVALVWLVILIISNAVGGGRRLAEPPSEFSRSTAMTPPRPTDDGLPHFHKYAYVLVTYDHSGHDVIHQFYDQLRKKINGQGKRKPNYVHGRIEFNTETKCTELNLEPDTITILRSPEFHCNMQKLRSLFMDHKEKKKGKLGVKLVHLVRNPFSMAVANYQYHKSSTEAAMFRNPCSPSPRNLTMTIADLNSATLTENGIMTHEDFDDILSQCRGIYQTRPGLKTSSYQQHLRALAPADGLRLAAANGLNPLALMASDLITFGRVRAMVRAEADNPERKKVRHFDLMTLSLEEALAHPGRTMVDFMDFAFGAQRASAGSEERVAAEYDHPWVHRPIVEDVADAAETEEFARLLRNDPLLGGPLTRVESLLHSVLYEREGGEIEA